MAFIPGIGFVGVGGGFVVGSDSDYDPFPFSLPDPRHDSLFRSGHVPKPRRSASGGSSASRGGSASGGGSASRRRSELKVFFTLDNEQRTPRNMFRQGLPVEVNGNIIGRDGKTETLRFTDDLHKPRFINVDGVRLRHGPDKKADVVMDGKSVLYLQNRQVVARINKEGDWRYVGVMVGEKKFAGWVPATCLDKD